MSCPAIALPGMTPEKYASLLETANAKGLALSGDSGATSYQGIDFTWSYNQPAATLTIQCTVKPFFIPCSMIEQKIQELVS
jgi:hypothetical protein